MSGEKRWIVLADDGRHTTLGRHTDPSAEEIDRAGAQLNLAGLGGWLAVMEGSYYRARQKVSLLMVREIAPARASWEHATAAFQACREGILQSVPEAPRGNPLFTPEAG